MTILGADGLPVRRPATTQNPRRNRAEVGRLGLGSLSGAYPYRAAEPQSQELGLDYFPLIRSPDGEFNIVRDRVVSRARDLTRNDGFARGGIDRILDNTIGAQFRLLATPDHKALAGMGYKVDLEWATLFRRRAESLWRSFADDPGHYNDVSRQLTATQQFRLLFRHHLIDGEDLSVAYWLPERVGAGGARFATSFLVVDPDRLSNPFGQPDTRYLRGGVEIDDYGVPVAFHVRRAHQNDWYNAAESMQWERIQREDEDGWLRVIHNFDRDRAGQNRGIGVFTSVLSHAKMLSKYYGVELQAATLQSILGFFITSEQDPALVEEALGGGDENEEVLFDFRKEFYDEHPVTMNGVRVPILPAGDEVKAVAAQHPSAGFNGFHREMQRSIAAAIGITPEQLAGSWSEMNYSSARAALLEIWKTMDRRRRDFGAGTASKFYGLVLREALENGMFDDINPGDMPAFREAAAAYCSCRWMGPGRGWIDPVKEAQGSALALDTGLTTLSTECANNGLDYEEVLEQRASELALCRKLDIPPPAWLGSIAADTASDPEEKPRPQ